MDLIYSFDSKRFHLGTLCKYGHRWPGTDLSLRRTSIDARGRDSSGCAGCTGRKRSDWLISFIDAQAMKLPAGWSFGKLCKAEHRWNGHEMSLRNQWGKCYQCEQVRAKSQEKKDTTKKWQAANRQHRLEYWRRRYDTEPDFRLYIRQKSKRRKAQMRDSVAIQIKGRDIRARFQQFEHRCAYCGSDGELHIEHVVPISKGGTHALGNIVPACSDCNYNKTAHEVESWYRSQPFFSETRWRKICRVLGWNRSAVGQLSLL